MVVQQKREKPKSMFWIVFVAGAVLSWGAYGALLHQGQTQLGNPLKALLCVGVAYFLIGILIPVGALGSQGQLNSFNSKGLITATIAGALGAIGAACIIWAFRNGGLTGLCDASRVRGRARSERHIDHGSSSSKISHQSVLVPGISFGVDWRRYGPVLQAAILSVRTN
jgi:hypothetical protein